MAQPRVILVDGSSLIYRAYFAIPSNFSTTAGLPTNAIYGFATMFRKILGGRTPEFGAVVFDAPGRTFRAERYPEYKAQRPRMDSRLREQLPHIDELVDAHGFMRLRMTGWEADDLIGTLTRLALERDMEVFIISGDKDFAQLIGKQVRMVDTLRDITYDPELVRKKWGVKPPFFTDYLGILGDKSDNIPGVPGIGQKGAAKLIGAHGHLEAILAAAEAGKLAPRETRALEEHRAQAELSKELATIDQFVPLEGSEEHDAILPGGFEALALSLPDASALNEIYRRYEFYSLLGEEEARSDEEIDVSLDYQSVQSMGELRSLARELRASEYVAVLPMMDEVSAAYGALAGLAFSMGKGHGRYLSIDGVDGFGDDALSLLQDWFEDPQAKKLSYDAKRLYMQLLRRERAIELRGVFSDVQLESFLVNPTKIIPHGLGAVVKEYLHETIAPRKRVTGSGKETRMLSELELHELEAWACQRADVVGQLAPLLRPKVQEAGLESHLYEVDLELAWVLGRMELAGIAVDSEDLRASGEEFAARLVEYEKKIFGHAGREFNIRSNKQLGEVLFDELKLPVIKRTKSGYSTNAEVLERLRPQHEIAALLLDHRKLTKLINTYTRVLQAAVRPETGRIHCVYQQTVGATGRLISTDPDLQRTPVKTAEGIRIRQAFVPPTGTQLVCADWSQIELRILAHVTEDPNLLDAFRSGDDVHRRTAAQLFDMAPEEVTKKERDVGKLVNFATIYGQGASALGQILGVKRSEAQAYIQGYFEAYQGVRQWLDETIAAAHAQGFVTTLSGRRRFIPELSSNAFMERQAGERIAANTPIQGSAADLCKQAMLDIDAEIRRRGLASRMLVQVHDELIFEAPDLEVAELSEIVRDKMEHAADLLVPLVVDLGVGRSWAEAKA